MSNIIYSVEWAIFQFTSIDIDNSSLFVYVIYSHTSFHCWHGVSAGK